jgi:multiple inositol-polyphosphate phosphatase/2,3-bisphosphoglycerate 3-phosphatase
MKNVQSEQPLQAPMRPPQRRLWRGSLVAPFGANTALVLYKCPSDSAHGKYLVQALHNEKPVVMPVSIIAPKGFFWGYSSDNSTCSCV